MPDSGSLPPPLNGKFIVIACSAHKSAPLVAGMEALGASVLPLHVIDIQEVEDKAPLDAALDEIGKYNWILFTSTYAVKFFARRMEERGTDLSELPQVKEIYYDDPTFVVDESFTQKMCNAIIDSKIKVKWSCVTRANISVETLRLMKKGLQRAAATRTLIVLASHMRKGTPHTGVVLQHRLCQKPVMTSRNRKRLLLLLIYFLVFLD